MIINNVRYQHTDLQIHKASQIIAFLGKQLAEEKVLDDSHTTLRYDADINALIGRKIAFKKKTFRASLYLSDFTFRLHSKDESWILRLEGKRIPKVISKVKKRFGGKKLTDFHLHYELPEEYEWDQYRITTISPEAGEEWGQMRQLANQVLTDVNTLINPASPINIWPHHFDTGTYHVLAENKQGASASVGTGFAMADTVSAKPYFYIYGWAKDREIDFSNAPKLPFGQWKTGQWKGAIVALDTLNQMTEPRKDLAMFFEKAFSFLQTQL